MRSVDALRRPLENDEGVSLTIGSMPVGQALDFLRTGDAHPPLFFIWLHAMESIHAPIWSIRLLMAAMGTLSVVLLMLLVRRWSTPQAAAVAGMCAAVMPVFVYYDTWLRMYTPFVCLSLLSFWLLSVLDAGPKSNVPRSILWAAWIVTTTAALYDLYLAWMVLGAQVLFAATRGRKMFLQTAVAAVVAALLWLPQVPTFVAQLSGGGVSLAWNQSQLAANLWQLPGQATIVPQMEGTLADVGAVIAWLWIRAAFACAWPRFKNTILPWLAAPAVLTLGYSVLANKLLYLDRYYLLFSFALCAATGVAYATIAERWPRSRIAIVLPGVALVALGCAYALDPAFYTADWVGVTAALSERAEPGDLLMFEQGGAYWAFKYYASGLRNPILMVTVPDEIDRAMAVADRHRRVWLIGSELRHIDPDLRLLHHLESGYRLSYFEELTRMLPTEDLEVGLFVKK